MSIEGISPSIIVEKAAERHGWKELGELLGVSRQAIHLWKCGKRVPCSKVVMRCMELIGNDGLRDISERVAEHRDHSENLVVVGRQLVKDDVEDFL
jgi:predicted transcriptional regulator